MVRNEFAGVVKNAVAGFGFYPELAMVTFPIDVFLTESDLSPIEQEIDKIIEGLTGWEPKSKAQGRVKPSKVRVEGKNYEDALNNMNALFSRNLWSDGLPLLPPTEEHVSWILRGTDFAPETELGRLLPRSGIVTIETLAVSLAMAGGRPEYLPILMASVEAILDPSLKHQKWQATSESLFPVVIVDGPVAEQIRLNSGFGLVGPHPGFPAGGSIGRALRLLQQNVGGALPGVGSMAQFGGMRYTNAVFAEDEEHLPPDWEPINVEYLGYPRGTNTVAVTIAGGVANIVRRGTGKETLDEEAITSLHIIASYLRSFNVGCFDGYEDGTPGVLILSATIARQMANLGWTKNRIKRFLWENSRTPLAEIRQNGLDRWIEFENLGYTLRDPWPITSKPENLLIVVAGGMHPTNAYWMQSGMSPRVASAEVRLPKNWGKLLREAATSVGPRSTS